jgi:hypothetical protein
MEVNLENKLELPEMIVRAFIFSEWRTLLVWFGKFQATANI